MPNLEPAGNLLPEKKRLEVEKMIFKDLSPDFELIELIITIQDENINIKELSAYLDFIYHTDGSLSKLNFLSYSKMPRMQLEITQIRHGSWEIVIEKIINSVDGQNLIILFLVLKYLPDVISSSLDGVHKYYEILNSREDYLEKKSKRKFRSPLKKAINEDELLANNTQKERDRLYSILSKFYKKKNLPASRFSKKYIKDIQLRPKRKKIVPDNTAR